jgi:glycosyltransferase involved in cell wall biosynthesis
MKLIFVIPTLDGGGAEKILVNIVNKMDHSKFDITLLSIFNQGIYIDKLNEGIKYVSFFKAINRSTFTGKIKHKFIYFLLRIANPRFLYKLLIKEKYDIEIAFLEGLTTRILSGSSSSKKLAWVHTDLIRLPWSTSFYKNLSEEIKAYKKYNGIYCVSTEVRDAFVEKFGIHSNIQLNLLDDSGIIESSKTNLANWNYKGQFNVVSVGRLSNPKGYKRLIKIHKKLLDLGINYNLHIIGEGEDRGFLEKYIESNNIKKNTILWGFQKNPYNIIVKCDLFVSSSYAEGYSSVIGEAIILGLPIITTDCAGMKDFLGNSEYGLIVPNDDIALYEGLLKMIENKEYYNHYKKMVLMRGVSLKSSKRIKEYEDIFNCQI